MTEASLPSVMNPRPALGDDGHAVVALLAGDVRHRFAGVGVENHGVGRARNVKQLVLGIDGQVVPARLRLRRGKSGRRDKGRVSCGVDLEGCPQTSDVAMIAVVSRRLACVILLVLIRTPIVRVSSFHLDRWCFTAYHNRYGYQDLLLQQPRQCRFEVYPTPSV